MTNQTYPFADVSLARRLENAEAHGNVLFIEARARAFPESGAKWMEANFYVDVGTALAGQTVTFSCVVMDVRKASREELTHGHVHGAGGHHH